MCAKHSHTEIGFCWFFFKEVSRGATQAEYLPAVHEVSIHSTNDDDDVEMNDAPKQKN